MKTGIINRMVFTIQKILLRLSYMLFSRLAREEKDLVVIGVDEVANNIHNMATAFDQPYTVNFTDHKFYTANAYDFDLRKFNLGFIPLHRLRLLIGPVILGYLASKARTFVYLGNTGFLHNSVDGRSHEFSFLKSHGKILTCFFCGSDIRSPKLSLEHAKEHGIDVMMTYLAMLSDKYKSHDHESFLQAVAESADSHADHIFNAPFDQISYLKREVHPFVYFQPDDTFFRNDQKFTNMDRIRIFHAPSSPFIKGTQIIRAAIKKLEMENYRFDYVELMNEDNGKILEELRRSHIVVNELYAFVPGVFGVEALSSHCALLTSADPAFEPSLPSGSDKAWMITHYWEVYDNLKKMLDNPDLIKPCADRGYEWAFEHCRTSGMREKMCFVMEPRP